MNVNLKEKVAQIYARKGTREAPARWRIPLLFLALLIPAIAGQLAAAEEPVSGNYVLVVDVYSGAVPPDVTQEKEFWFGLESVKKGQEPERVKGSGFPRSSILTMCSRRKISILVSRLTRMDRRSLSRVMSPARRTATRK
jgi:hypothetical protein